VDNLFVFLLIMQRFRVPERLQQFALMIGIIIAIVLRGLFIARCSGDQQVQLGVLHLRAFLIYTAVKLAKEARAMTRSTRRTAS
jgi:tellurite resistance protein TerC